MLDCLVWLVSVGQSCEEPTQKAPQRAGALVLACFLEEPKNLIATVPVNSSELWI